MYLESWRYCSPRFLQVRPSSQTRSPHTSHPCTLQGSTVHFFSVHTTHVMIQHLCTELLTPFTPAASALGRGREEGRPGPGERGPAALPAATGNEGGTEGRRQGGRRPPQGLPSGRRPVRRPSAGQRHGLLHTGGPAPLRGRSHPGKGPGGKSGGAARFLAPWPDFSPAARPQRSPSPRSRSPSRPPGHVKSRVMRLNPAPSRGAAGRAGSQLGPCPGEPPRRPERPQLFQPELLESGHAPQTLSPSHTALNSAPSLPSPPPGRPRLLAAFFPRPPRAADARRGDGGELPAFRQQPAVPRLPGAREERAPPGRAPCAAPGAVVPGSSAPVREHPGVKRPLSSHIETGLLFLFSTGPWGK